MAAELRVNGQTYNRFKQLNGVYSIDTFAGEVQITVSQPVNNNSPIKENDLIEIFLDGIQRFTGYVEKIGDELDKDNHDVTFSARDIVADLIDSSVPENVKSLDGVTTFAELVNLCITGLKLNDLIKVIDNVGATLGDSKKLKAASTGQKVREFLNEYARIANVFLNTDGKGNVLIQKPLGRLKTSLQLIPKARDNNILKSSLKIDNSQRYNRYTIYSNSSLASDDSTVNDLNNSGTAFDNDIRTTRVYEKIAEKPMTSGQCKKAAEEEANIRRARSFSYSCQVVGFSANAELWQPGKLVSVRDTGKGIEGEFLTNTIKWSASRAGDIVDIDITLPDKNTIEANASALTKKTTQGSSTYGIQAGDTLSQLAINFNISPEDLIIANPQITDPDLIFTGRTIVIPNVGSN